MNLLSYFFHWAFRYFALWFFLSFGTTALVFAEQDVWMIDTQSVSWTHANDADFEQIEYRRLQNNRWEYSNSATFFDSHNPVVPLIIFVPGYTSTTANTIEVGLGIMRLLPSNKSYRMVFWNWPSQRVVHILRPDIRAKIPVAVANGYYLTRFLQSLKPESCVCLLGFSFGNRILGEAIANLRKETHSEKKVDQEKNLPEKLRIRMVMASPATDQHDFAEGAKYAQVPELVEKILILYNPMDFRLMFYPFLYDSEIQINALGRYGPSASVRQKFQDRIEAVNIDSYIGVRHRTLIVLNTPPFRQRINTYLFFVQD
ncbi:MAG: alpha/beta hydrolase [Planctomycetaceae bacterium]|jgi:esterase/lipase superfamily enzyme|nr:alpha/beta hydrolase [Planctomycetaceae bacterium]